MSAGREVWVKVRASEAERAEWHTKARSVGLSLSDLVRRSVGRVRTWTVAHAELEQQLTTALTALSEQYEREQRRQAEQVEALQEQMQRLEEAVKDLKPQLGQTEALAEDLKRQVKRLAADYKQIAEVLRGV